MQEFVGWAGFFTLLLAWVPQTWATIRAGRTDLNAGFIVLYFAASLLLTVYSVLKADAVFSVLNGVLTCGSAISLYYRFRPRVAPTPAVEVAER